MKEDAGCAIPTLKVDGGASVSNPMMQFQSDILDTPVYRPKNVETTVTGAAFLAGLAVGVWHDKDELLGFWKMDKLFTPDMENKKRDALYASWKRAVERAKGWAIH